MHNYKIRQKNIFVMYIFQMINFAFLSFDRFFKKRNKRNNSYDNRKIEK